MLADGPAYVVLNPGIPLAAFPRKPMDREFSRGGTAGFGRQTMRSVSEKAKTIGPISFAERMPVASLAAKRSPVRYQAADCSLELQFAIRPDFGPGRSIAFNLARAFNRLWLEIRLVL